MVVKKLLVDGKITACVKGVVCKVSNRKRLSCKKNCFLEKCLLSIFKFCASSNLLFFYEMLIGLQPTLLGCIVICESDWSTLSRWTRLQESHPKYRMHKGDFTQRDDSQQRFLVPCSIQALSRHCTEICCCKSPRVTSP